MCSIGFTNTTINWQIHELMSIANTLCPISNRTHISSRTGIFVITSFCKSKIEFNITKVLLFLNKFLAYSSEFVLNLIWWLQTDSLNIKVALHLYNFQIVSTFTCLLTQVSRRAVNLQGESKLSPCNFFLILNSVWNSKCSV